MKEILKTPNNYYSQQQTQKPPPPIYGRFNKFSNTTE